MSGGNRAGAGAPQDERPDKIDYEHRHFVNLAACAVLLALMVVSIWTVQAFDSQESRLRCFQSGRKDCVPIPAPPKGFVQLVR